MLETIGMIIGGVIIAAAGGFVGWQIRGADEQMTIMIDHHLIDFLPENVEKVIVMQREQLADLRHDNAKLQRKILDQRSQIEKQGQQVDMLHRILAERQGGGKSGVSA